MQSKRQINIDTMRDELNKRMNNFIEMAREAADRGHYKDALDYQSSTG